MYPYSDLVASTTAGGNVTLTCIQSTGNHRVRWLMHTLGEHSHLNIMNEKFKAKRPHIIRKTSNYSYHGEDEVAFSITLSNLTDSVNNSLVVCEVTDSNRPCSVIPIHPFVLRILPNPDILPPRSPNRLPDSMSTLPPQTDSPNTSPGSTNTLPPQTGSPNTSPGSTSTLPPPNATPNPQYGKNTTSACSTSDKVLYFFIGAVPTLVLSVTISIGMWCSYYRYSTKFKSHRTNVTFSDQDKDIAATKSSSSEDKSEGT